MKQGTRAMWVSGAALVIAVVALIVAVASGGGGDASRTGAAGDTVRSASPSAPQAPAEEPTAPATGPLGAPSPSQPPSSPEPTDTATASAGSVTCPAPTVMVGDAKSLDDALENAMPGDVIGLADGTYKDKFTAETAGTSDRPIWVCGGPGAVIDAGDVAGGYAFHLDGASYWRLVGFTVRNGQKGVMADHVEHAVIQGLTVEHIGDEAIHLRNFSSDNVVRGNTVRDTGLRKPKFGEGVYIGSAESNWCTVSKCKPDNSDRNVVTGNRISATTAESIDIKEGTTGGTVTRNTFDGSDLSGDHNDSWVDVKGNSWTISFNTGSHAAADGFQTHEILKGWGRGNTFKGNVAHVDGPGYGFNLTPVNGNKVTCDNKVTGAGKGLTNTDCAD
ncbi:nitrous oxide reductase family maturation protein NosD [Streptomyces sp. NPDC088354]|uniref:right-handed parallel beta-helix repeat-containing protein n=1 Tax=unclassified Streptomyces TaxID=2593676 RepID=UPI0029A4A234|nr:right-handed parallel beta-helix repeat-containing protein [Streptomyces sp. MI02-7b]MDX3076786.1 right-handed parallel beta-helix repeat-containing protein [Streptomyces sp. MI02-7b]